MSNRPAFSSTRPRYGDSRIRGLTLIELLATTALAAILMTTVLQVVAMTGRTKASMDDSPLLTQNWQDQLVRQIESDLSNAQTVRWSDGQLFIEGWGGWDRRTREPSHEPAIVTYQLLQTGSSQTLVRSQRDILDLGQQRPSRCVFAWNVARWEMNESALDTDATYPQSQDVTPAEEGSSPQKIEIEFADGDRLVIPLPTDSFITSGGGGGAL